jgi:hypothetical protein
LWIKEESVQGFGLEEEEEEEEGRRTKGDRVVDRLLNIDTRT